MSKNERPDATLSRHFEVLSADPALGHPMRHGDRLLLGAIDFVENLEAPAHYALAAALVALVFALDVMTGSEVSFSIFFLLPISMLAWHHGWRASLVAVVVSGAAWVLADILTDHVYSHPAIRYWNALVRMGFFVIVGGILVQLRRSVDVQQRLARLDSLTGVVNSRWFLQIAATEVARQQRYGHPLSIAFLDCDNFKQVNDRLGHAAGDDLLKRIGAGLEQTVRSVDTVARLGGDEFALLMPETGAPAASTVCEKVRAALAEVVAEYNVTFSIGLVTYVEPPVDVKAMVHTADQAMYDAKKTGKDSSRHRIIGHPVVDGTTA